MARTIRPLGAAVLGLTIIASAMSAYTISAFAAGGSAEYRIRIENGIHYLPDSETSGGKIILFCMNNKSNWPHEIPGSITESQVPSYVDGYLTPADFESNEKYLECMNRLSAILYAGYPHNAAGLYQIRESGYTMTEADFNELLKVPARLRSDFSSSLGDATFSYADYTNGNTANLNRLKQFLIDLGYLFPSGKTASGLSYSDITAMPFYKAAYCMYSANSEQTPIEVFNAIYGGVYYVTEEQAYNATQNAVWKLLASCGIEDNDLTDISSTPLGEILLEASKHISPLTAEPQESEVKIQAVGNDYTLSYNPDDGKWYSDIFLISENKTYKGKYVFSSLPAGVSVITQHGGDYVRPGERFSFVSDHKLESAETVGITSSLNWIGALLQYSPVKTSSGEDVIVNGKKFQHMAGAQVYSKTLSLGVTLTNDETTLKISKKVVGGSGSGGSGGDQSFRFRLELTNRPIDGKYGDLTFHSGIAEFTLKDGESVTASYLPQGTKYKVTETPYDDYTITSTNASGTLAPGASAQVEFVNTRKGSSGGGTTDPGEPGNPTDPGDPDNPGDPSDPGTPTDPTDPGSSDSGNTDNNTGNMSGGSNGAESSVSSGPQTGDASMLNWYIGAAVLSIGGIAAASIRRRRRRAR